MAIINDLGYTLKIHRTNGTFGFCRYSSQRFKKPKDPFVTDEQDDNFSNTFYLVKRYDQNIKPILAIKILNYMNRIKEVLEEKGIKQIWLADQLGKSYNMVNGYVQNRQQPRLEILYEIARLLKVTQKDLIKDTYVNDKK